MKSIAALLLVALVAAGQAQAMPERYETQDAQVNGMGPFDFLSLKQMRCILEGLQQLDKLSKEVMQYREEISAVLIEIGKNAVFKCISAADKWDCAGKVYTDYVNKAGLNSNVKMFLEKAAAINDSTIKCFRK